MASKVKTLAAPTQSWFHRDPELQVEIPGSTVNQLGLQIISNRNYVCTNEKDQEIMPAHISPERPAASPGCSSLTMKEPQQVT